MSFEAVWLVSIVELDCSTTGSVWLNLYSDLPAGGMEIRETHIIDTSAATAGSKTNRGVVRFRCAGTTKGRLFQFEIAGTQVVRIFGGRYYAKAIGVAPSNWQWFEIAGIVPTSEEWAALPLPIPPTSEEWTALHLPIPPTSEEWTALHLPIPPTSEEWTPLRLPIKATSDEQQWVNVQVAL